MAADGDAQERKEWVSRSVVIQRLGSDTNEKGLHRCKPFDLVRHYRRSWALD